MAIASDRSMRFRKAAKIAVLCSAALPIMATTNTPTNRLPSPRAFAAGSIAATRISLIQATATVASPRTAKPWRFDRAGVWGFPAASASPEPSKSRRWVTRLMSHIEVTKLVRAGEALHGERSLCRDQDTRLLSRVVRAEQLVELLEH